MDKETEVKCTKCDTYLVKDLDGVYTCEKCLKEAVRIKRELWNEESKEKTP